MKQQLVLFCALFIVTNSFAQGEDDDYSTELKTSFGIKAGYNNSQMKIEDQGRDYVKRDAGVYVGAFINFPTSETFSVQPEVIYSSSRYNVNDNIDLIHIPVSLKFELANNFTGFIGPEGQFLLGIGDVDTDLFNTFMFGFFFGANYEVAPHFFIEARPYFALSRLLDNGPGISRKLNTLQVGLAYQF
ncbi:MAG: porin family protein [Flavobacteriaceae bacterium]